MKIKVLPHIVAKNVLSEDQLSDLPIIESIYQIRALKAAIDLNGKVIDVEEKNIKNNQVYLETHQIWLQPETWRKV